MNTLGGLCLCLEDTPRAIGEGHTTSALLHRLLAAMQSSIPHTKARGGVCRKAAASNHHCVASQSFHDYCIVATTE